MLIAAALLLVLVALLATPAFGIQGSSSTCSAGSTSLLASRPSAPNLVKKQFLDLPLGAPAQFSPQINAAEARVVATFSIAGHPRKLWIAPTRQGGYCYTFELSFGGCRRTLADRSIGGKGQFGVTWQGGSSRLGVNESIVTRVGGDLTAPAAAKITASYADGSSAEIPFVWVSSPISAGFYSYDIPRAHWTKQARLRALTLFAGNGRRLGRQTFHYEAQPPQVRVPRPTVGTPKRRVLPTAPSVPPSTPIQQGSADGFKVVVGHNGEVQFTQIGVTPILRRLVGQSAGFSCFRLTTEFGIFTSRGIGQGGRFAPKVGFELNGVGAPADGCEVQASIGRTWPDQLGEHAAAEIPLTPAGRRYFADRAAARDLALFVRSRRMHELRKEPAARAKRDIEAAYRRNLATSAIQITLVNPTTLRFRERSGTGKQFDVTVRNGRIAKQNLKPYGFVF